MTISNGITSIGTSVFSGCSGLVSVTIPNGVMSIGDGAFERCSSLVSVTIPNGVMSIGDGAFDGCSSLVSVTIPNSVTSIGLWAFEFCCNLTEVYSLNPTPPTFPDASSYFQPFNGRTYWTATLYVPEEALEAYKNAEYWKNFRNIKGFAPTGMKGIEADGNGKRNVYYDLNGRRLSAPRKGLNIINGKKVIVK